METTTTSVVPTLRRRPFQFRLRTLLVLMFVFGCVFGWIAYLRQERERARRREAAIEAFDELAIAAGRGGEEDNAEDRLGGDLDTSIDLSGLHVADAELAHLSALPRLVSLRLGSTHVTDAGLVHVKRLTQLRVLDLSNTEVTDVGLKQICCLSQLKVLELDGTGVTDAGLQQLVGLTHLERLSLIDTQITDAGLIHVRGLTQLLILEVQGTEVTNRGVNEIKRALPNVRLNAVREIRCEFHEHR